MMYLEDNYADEASKRDLRLRRTSLALSALFGEQVTDRDVREYGLEVGKRRPRSRPPRRSELRDFLAFENMPYYERMESPDQSP